MLVPRMHIYREEAAIFDVFQNSSFPAKRLQRHAKDNFGDDKFCQFRWGEERLMGCTTTILHVFLLLIV